MQNISISNVKLIFIYFFHLFLLYLCLSRSIILVLLAPQASQAWIWTDPVTWLIPHMNLKRPADQTHTNHVCPHTYDEIRSESQAQHHWQFPKHTRLTDVWYFYVPYRRSKWRTFPNPHWPYCAWVIQPLDFTQDSSIRSTELCQFVPLSSFAAC